MKELQRYLGDIAAGDEGNSDWSKYKMMGYINQRVVTRQTPSQIGIRNQKELITLGTRVDLLLCGRLAELGESPRGSVEADSAPPRIDSPAGRGTEKQRGTSSQEGGFGSERKSKGKRTKALLEERAKRERKSRSDREARRHEHL